VNKTVVAAQIANCIFVSCFLRRPTIIAAPSCVSTNKNFL